MLTHIYDFQGKSPEHVVIPHVAYQAKSASTGQSYAGVILLDTGAKSDITFKRTLKKQIAEKLETQTVAKRPLEQLSVTFRIGPLSAIKHPKGSYDTDSQTDVGEVDEGKLLPAKELSIGFRDDDSSTLSMKYCKLTGRCASFNPDDGNRVEIKNFYSCPVYSTDVSFSEDLGAYDHLVSYKAKHIDPQPPTNFMPPKRVLDNKKDENICPALKGLTTAFCWDSGAAVNTIPQALVTGWKIGKPAGEGKAIIDEISVLTSNHFELLRFTNVPVDTDTNLFVIGAPILNLFNIGIDPTGGTLGLSILNKGLWKSEVVDFGQTDNATFLAPW